jgi:hypothetical protein
MRACLVAAIRSSISSMALAFCSVVAAPESLMLVKVPTTTSFSITSTWAGCLSVAGALMKGSLMRSVLVVMSASTAVHEPLRPSSAGEYVVSARLVGMAWKILRSSSSRFSSPSSSSTGTLLTSVLPSASTMSALATWLVRDFCSSTSSAIAQCLNRYSSVSTTVVGSWRCSRAAASVAALAGSSLISFKDFR